MSVDKEVVASPPTADEKTPYDSVESNDANNVNHERPSTNLLGAKSPGVQRIEAVSQHIQNSDRIFIFLGIFLVAYAYGLDGMIRFTYQSLAVADYQNHSLLATVNVLRSVIGAAAQPTAAKIADVFGRVEVIFITIIFYAVGTIVEACSTNVQAFSGGAILYQIGYTGILLMVEVLVADVTSLRSRVIFSYIPALPFIINTWISGNVTDRVIAESTWQWGIGMWAIIYPVCCVPLLVSLYVVQRRAKKAGTLDSYKTPYQMLGPIKLLQALFWQLDVIGVILMIGIFAMILVPFTLAGGFEAQWKTAKVIAPLVIGVLLIPVWIVWERKCQHPMVPFRLLKDRAVWGALGLSVMLNTAWYMQGDYLLAVLVLGFDESLKSATRIQSLYSFASVITGAIAGLIIFKVRRLKMIIVAGTVLFLVAFGLLIRFRGGAGSSSHSGIIGAQVLLGIAGGLFPYPAQASIQAATKHEHVAVITGLYLACYNIGSSLGASISGAMWNQILPKTLESRLGSADLAAEIYGDPFAFAGSNPVGTPERDGAIEAYKHVQRLLCITGICLSVLLIAFAMVLRDPVLGKEQSLANAEKDSDGDTSSTDDRVR